MSPAPQLLVVLLLTLTLTLTHAAKLTSADWAAARAADSEITHLSQKEFASLLAAEAALARPNNIPQSRWVVFFGALWCPNTAKFNAKWLKVQKDVENFGYEDGYHFRMFKVECSHDEEFCVKEHHVDGYPRTNIYVNGKYKLEYPDADEYAPLLQYVNKLITETTSKSASPVSDSKPAEPVPAVKPAKPIEEAKVEVPVKVDLNSSEKKEDEAPMSGSELRFSGLLVIVIAVSALLYRMFRGRSAGYSKLSRSI